MKRLIFGSLSILLLSSVVKSPITAEAIGAKNLIAKHSSIAQILLAQEQISSLVLTAIADDGIPEGLTQEKWLAAKGEVSVSPVKDDSYTVTLKASNLVPNGLYTFWWVNKKLVGMDMGPAGGTPANEFRADNNGNAIATITVPADNNYQTLAVAYHADNQTHGQMPGEMGKVTFTHLMGDFPKPTSVR
ncbi:MAG: hypothetical protein D6756_01410 [Cyanobacteria bacterium J083]|nr:MAG: hypothetical protein D6756_01410 [Cyanobacteria bacterium J083]